MDDMEADRKVFSISIGRTSETSMQSKLERFKANLRKDALMVFDLPILICAFDVEGKKRVGSSEIDLPSKIHFGNGWGTYLEINFTISGESVIGANAGVRGALGQAST